MSIKPIFKIRMGLVLLKASVKRSRIADHFVAILMLENSSEVVYREA